MMTEPAPNSSEFRDKSCGVSDIKLMSDPLTNINPLFPN